MTQTVSAETQRPAMDIRPIRNAEDLSWALAQVDADFASKPGLGLPDGARFEVLHKLIGADEAETYPIESAGPIAFLEYAVAEMGRSQADLAARLGSRARASEILSRKRPLSLAQIRTVSAAWHLPIDGLAAPYRLARDAA